MAHSKFSRRNFAKRMVLGAAAIPIGAATVVSHGAEEPTGEGPVIAKKPVESPDSAPTISEGDLALAIVMLRYPDLRLDGTTLTSIRIEIARNLERSRQLGSYPLKNSDAPAFRFAAYDTTNR